ncbi:beta propeller repeat protein [Nocardioides pantholopis]|uniref:hypothetical protein n=1 Tax=Nocardioides pantholopis TaxID=2483798 RepID=UPI0013DDC551|nr:hypothetical protein [Nocardioides pantholopis]
MTGAPAQQLSADSVVDHPEAQLLELVVAPGSAAARATVWQVCLDDGCQRSQRSIAVTGDGFRTRWVTAVPRGAQPTLAALSRRAFYVGWSRRAQLVVHTDGRTVPVRDDGTRGPVTDRETLVPTPDGQPRALDPRTARMHRVPTPRGTVSLAHQPDGTLLGVVPGGPARTSRAVWSSDGGASWRDEVLATEPGALLAPVPTARPGVLALVEGGDGATLFPFERLHRSQDGGASWESVDLPGEPRAYLTGAAVLPDGRLLAGIEAWSDDRLHRPSARPLGLYLSAGPDWARLAPARVGAPFTARNEPGTYRQVAMDTTADGVAVYAQPGTADQLYVSRDGGRRWRELAAR